MESELTEELYELTLAGEGLNLNRKVPVAVARAIMNIVMGGQFDARPVRDLRPELPPSRVDGGATGRSSERQSLREYLDEHEAARNPDKITAIGNYLVEFEGCADFSRDEVKSRFRSAGEPPPGNYPRDFTWAMRAGWIAEDTNAPGRFYVTQKGRSAIAGKFSAEIKKSTAQAKGNRRARRKGGTDNSGAEPE